jgi:probable DNA repair protein
MPPAAAISRQQLFTRLAEGHAAGITVVTPNRRLAQALRADFDVFQLNKNKTVWEDADILPLDAFVARGYEDALYGEEGGKLPLLLAPAQERELWEEAVRASPSAGLLLDAPRTAARAMDAWRLAQAWGLAGMLEKFDATEDTRAFAGWAQACLRRCRKDKLIEAARLPALELPAPKTKQLVAYAFDIVTPQAAELFSRFEFSTCEPEKKQGRTVKTSFASPKEELEAAARWARAKVEAGAKRVGVVVPELEPRRREVARVFERVMGSAAPFNLSLGEPLAAVPLVSFALHLLEFSLADKPFEEVSRLLRSPFLGGAASEAGARARLDAHLRREAPAVLSLPKLIGLISEDLRIRKIFESVYDFSEQRQKATRSPQDWAEHFAAVLAAAGFPGERALDSAEYQARAKFNELLGDFSRLALVTRSCSSSNSIRQLRRLCHDTLFQPESGDAPVQVLGLLESAGLEFDALWVSGLTDEAWPLRSRPNPFLPLALQRKAGIPEASAESSLALDARITEGWLRAADEVVVSCARRVDDRDLAPSPLIAGIGEGAPSVPEFPSFRDLIFKERKTETRMDEKATALPGKTVHGGTRVLADQAACPFRAFARHRLRAEALDSPEPGLDALDRGSLLHALMAGLWKELGSSSSLSQDVSSSVKKAAIHAVTELKLEGRFAKLEVQRLVRLANEWLEVERERPPFEVVQTEQKRELSIGGLALSGRIDRMDKLADGTHAIVDYKTGSRVTPNDWQGPRPDDPQLPLYAVTAKEPVGALAFAKLRPGDMKFSGFSLGKNAIPGVKQAESWEGLLKGWKAELESLAGGYAAGDAAVDPKRGLKTCERCDLHPLCRVHEKIGALDDEEGGE